MCDRVDHSCLYESAAIPAKNHVTVISSRLQPVLKLRAILFSDGWLICCLVGFYGISTIVDYLMPRTLLEKQGRTHK